jgi:hypothetical protein
MTSIRQGIHAANRSERSLHRFFYNLMSLDFANDAKTEREPDSKACP